MELLTKANRAGVMDTLRLQTVLLFLTLSLLMMGVVHSQQPVGKTGTFVKYMMLNSFLHNDHAAVAKM